MSKPVIASYVLIVLVVGAIVITDQPQESPLSAAHPPVFDAGRAMAHLAILDRLTRDGGGRTLHSRGHRDVTEYLARAMTESGLSCRIDRVQDPMAGTLQNVVAELPGGSGEVVILGAHQDASGPGASAVDGMTGLAVLLESARALKESRREARAAGGGAPPERTVLFASWDGESAGCAGSLHFLERYAKDTGRVRAVISLDSMGWKDGRPVVHAPRYFDRFGRAFIAPDWLAWNVVRSGSRAGVNAPLGDPYLSVPYQVALRMIDLGYYSDDRNFVLAGIPALFVSDFSLTHFYPYYDSPQDTLDQVGMEPLRQAGELVTAAVGDLAAMQVLPSGGAEYLLVPSPFGWARLTGDHLRLLACLFVIPGLIALGWARGRAGEIVLLCLYDVLAVVFLYGTVSIDPVVFMGVAGPAVLAAPLLAIGHRGAVYGYCTSILPPLACGVLVLPLFREGYAQQMLFPRKGLIALAVIVVIPAAMVLVRALVVRGRTELSFTSVPDAAALVPSPSEALEASREVQLGLELPVPGGTEASPPIDPGEPSQREPA